MSKPTKAQAIEAARSFLRHRDALGEFKQADLLMSLGRHFEFPAGTPTFCDHATLAAISAFIQAHAVEIE